MQERDDVILLQVRRGDQPGLRQSVHQPLRVSAASVANYLVPSVARFSYGAGHYTQVVWADTEELGCGMVHYTVQ